MRKEKKTAPKLKPGLTFNHAMVYSRDVAASLRFYRDLLGFKVIEDMEYHNTLVYARLQAPGGSSTLALHVLEPGKVLPPEDGSRLYFEIRDLERFCKQLGAAGVSFSRPPKVMPWGWMHTYLNDPDGHEVSL